MQRSCAMIEGKKSEGRSSSQQALWASKSQSTSAYRSCTWAGTWTPTLTLGPQKRSLRLCQLSSSGAAHWAPEPEFSQSCSRQHWGLFYCGGKISTVHQKIICVSRFNAEGCRMASLSMPPTLMVNQSETSFLRRCSSEGYWQWSHSGKYGQFAKLLWVERKICSGRSTRCIKLE